jgi:pimeloyl-ACP methyl ester carboxylesterase
MLHPPRSWLLDPSSELRAAWEAEESALKRGNIDAAVGAILDAWLLADAPAVLRDRAAAMQRHALEVQTAADATTEVRDPVEAHPEALGSLAAPTLVAAGELDMPDFRAGADALARRLPHARRVVIARARHLAPVEQPDDFRALLLD